MTKDELIQQMRETKATWQEDGKGVKGDPVLFHSESTIKAEPSSIIPRPPITVPQIKIGTGVPQGVDFPGTLT